MLDFNKYLMRHGECWIWGILRDIERRDCIQMADGIDLKERWDIVMNHVPSVAYIQPGLAA